MNQAMLAKHYWRIYQKPQSLISKTFKAKYFPRGSLQDCSPKPHHSWFWRNILDHKNTKLKESSWLIRNGSDIPLKHPALFPYQDQLIQNHSLAIGRVSDLIDNNAHNWKPNLIQSLYSPTISSEILKNPHLQDR